MPYAIFIYSGTLHLPLPLQIKSTQISFFRAEPTQFKKIQVVIDSKNFQVHWNFNKIHIFSASLISEIINQRTKRQQLRNSIEGQEIGNQYRIINPRYFAKNVLRWNFLTINNI